MSLCVAWCSKCKLWVNVDHYKKEKKMKKVKCSNCNGTTRSKYGLCTWCIGYPDLLAKAKARLKKEAESKTKDWECKECIPSTPASTDFPNIEVRSKTTTSYFLSGKEIFPVTINSENLTKQIEYRQFGSLREKGFYLNPGYRWSIVKDEQGYLVLIKHNK